MQTCSEKWLLEGRAGGTLVRMNCFWMLTYLNDSVDAKNLESKDHESTLLFPLTAHKRGAGPQQGFLQARPYCVDNQSMLARLAKTKYAQPLNARYSSLLAIDPHACPRFHV